MTLPAINTAGRSGWAISVKERAMARWLENRPDGMTWRQWFDERATWNLQQIAARLREQNRAGVAVVNPSGIVHDGYIMLAQFGSRRSAEAGLRSAGWVRNPWGTWGVPAVA